MVNHPQPGKPVEVSRLNLFQTKTSAKANQVCLLKMMSSPNVQTIKKNIMRLRKTTPVSRTSITLPKRLGDTANTALPPTGTSRPLSLLFYTPTTNKDNGERDISKSLEIRLLHVNQPLPPTILHSGAESPPSPIDAAASRSRRLNRTAHSPKAEKRNEKDGSSHYLRTSTSSQTTSP